MTLFANIGTLFSAQNSKKYHQELKDFLKTICINSVWYDGRPDDSKYVLPDRDDNIYLALSVKADYLVTGNKKDFPEQLYSKVKIVSPREFLMLD